MYNLSGKFEKILNHNAFWWSIVLGSVLLIGYGQDRNYKKFEQLVDTNHDGIISKSELKPIYNFLKIPFNEDNPAPLTESQLEQVIFSYKK